MNLPRHTISSHASPPIFVNAQFVNIVDDQIASTSKLSEQEQDQSRFIDKARLKEETRRRRGSSLATKSSTTTTTTSSSAKDDEKDTKTRSGSISMFACATRQGFFIAQTHPLLIVARRDFSSIQGGLSHISPIDNSSLLILVGGGRVPRFAPNKVILWDEEATQSVSISQKGKNRNVSASSSSSFEENMSTRASTIFSAEREGMTSSQNSEKLGNIGSDALAAYVEDDIKASSLPVTEISDEVQISCETPNLEEVGLASIEDTEGVPAETVPLAQSTLRSDTTSISSQTNESQDSVQYDTRKGKEVAEFEFGEAVMGISVKSFNIKSSSNNGEGVKASLMIVSLQTKAIIFEMGPHVRYETQVDKDKEDRDSSWGIRQRLVVEMQNGLERGLATMAPIPDSNCVLFALPGRQIGHVQVLSMALSNTDRTSIRSSIANASTIIAAHSNPISSLTLSDDGRILCTTSERGTLLRLWSTFGSSSSSSSKERSTVTNLSTNLLCELRRGSDSAKIWSVAFSPDSLLLAVASDKGTIHFFNLRPLHEVLYSKPSSRSSSPLPSFNNSNHPILNKKTNRFLPASIQQVANSIPPSILPQYLKSQWSFAQFKIPLKIFSSSIVEDIPRVSQPLFGGFQRDKYEMMEEQSAATRSKKQESLEGGWAEMKSRIDDVRRGEKGIQEGVWLTWISNDNISFHAQKATFSTTSSSSSSSTSKQQKEKEKKQSRSSCGFELVAITSSGNYYRIGVARPSSFLNKSSDSSLSHSHLKKKSTVLDMYKEDFINSGTDELEIDADGNDELDSNQSKDQCWLVEFQRFGMRDDWID